MYRILITSRNFGVVSPTDSACFIDRGYNIVVNPYQGSTPTEEQMCGLVGEVDAILAGVEPITEKVLSHAGRLKVISRFGTGVDSIDIPAATRRGVVVTNVRGANADSVADLALGLMLAVSKLIVFTNRRVMAGMWPPDRGHDIHGKTLGIVGFGNIGQAVAKRARGFDMRVLASDVSFNTAAAAGLGVSRSSMETITKESDYISLHLPLTSASANLFDAARLSRMKPGSYLINTARGGLIDEEALFHALETGHLAGAALDVLAVEPPSERPRLLDCANCLITSHSGGNSMESIALTARIAAQNIIDVLEGNPCANTVNTGETNG